METGIGRADPNPNGSPDVAVWVEQAPADDKRALELMCARLPADVAARVLEIAPVTQRGNHGMCFEAGLRRAYYVRHTDFDELRVVIFEEATEGLAEQLWNAIRDAWPVQLPELLPIYSRLCGRQIRLTDYQ